MNTTTITVAPVGSERSTDTRKAVVVAGQHKGKRPSANIVLLYLKNVTCCFVDGISAVRADGRLICIGRGSTKVLWRVAGHVALVSIAVRFIYRRKFASRNALRLGRNRTKTKNHEADDAR